MVDEFACEKEEGEVELGPSDRDAFGRNGAKELALEAVDGLKRLLGIRVEDRDVGIAVLRFAHGFKEAYERSQVVGEAPLIHAVSVRDMVEGELREALERTADFTHVRERAEVAVAGIEIGFRGLLVGERHAVVDAAGGREVVEEFRGIRLGASQGRFAVGEEAVEDRAAEFDRAAEIFRRLLIDHGADGRGIVADVALIDERVVREGRPDVRAYEKRNRRESEDHRHDFAAEEDEGRDDAGERARAEGRDEPARNHREDARNAVDGGFAVPGAVGKGRAHRDHEGDVGGRKRELEGRG